MTRRKRLLLWAGLMVVLAGVGLYGARQSVTSAPGVNPENFSRLHFGMTEADVERILGERGELSALFPPSQLSPPFTAYGKTWIGENNTIKVVFDMKDGCVLDLYANLSVPGVGREFLAVHESIFDRIRRWLGI